MSDVNELLTLAATLAALVLTVFLIIKTAKETKLTDAKLDRLNNEPVSPKDE